ncbi:MAG TPA: hydroxyacylglutathione hydrolase C-terminal domain-containing protein [Steroidobacteraceae bacterium]|jgi:hydroxyacylglutathione hydrolase
MLVERIWAANSLRNFNYLIACAETGEALVLDPLNATQCLEAARSRSFDITQVLNTHEHRDHTDGNAGVVAATRARVMAHADAARAIGGVDRGLARGDVIRIGRTVELEVLDTPGHTRSHVCLLAHGQAGGEPPALFCGDTLFNAGAGNCHHGGDPGLLYETFVNQLARLPDATRVYPGHDYLVNNLAFTLDREPGNAEAARALELAKTANAAAAPVTTLGEEKRVNTFFRLHNPEVITKLRERFPDIGVSPDARTVFIKLRELRNRW